MCLTKIQPFSALLYCQGMKLKTFLNDVGLHNVLVVCWELSSNLSVPVQLFEHPIVIF